MMEKQNGLGLKSQNSKRNNITTNKTGDLSVLVTVFIMIDFFCLLHYKLPASNYSIPFPHSVHI